MNSAHIIYRSLFLYFCKRPTYSAVCKMAADGIFTGRRRGDDFCQRLFPLLALTYPAVLFLRAHSSPGTNWEKGMLNRLQKEVEAQESCSMKPGNNWVHTSIFSGKAIARQCPWLIITETPPLLTIYAH